ncbi:hypothetical protein X975_19106, partial [Stegodyphus mimosarum]
MSFVRSSCNCLQCSCSKAFLSSSIPSVFCVLLLPCFLALPLCLCSWQHLFLFFQYAIETCILGFIPKCFYFILIHL